MGSSGSSHCEYFSSNIIFISITTSNFSSKLTLPYKFAIHFLWCGAIFGVNWNFLANSFFPDNYFIFFSGKSGRSGSWTSLSPDERAIRAARNIRSNQLNPNNRAYYLSRGLRKPDESHLMGYFWLLLRMFAYVLFVVCKLSVYALFAAYNKPVYVLYVLATLIVFFVLL